MCIVHIHVWMDGWMEISTPAKARLFHMPRRAGLCRTMPDFEAQRWTHGLLSLVGDLISLPTLYRSQQRGSCHDASAIQVSRMAEAAHTCITIVGARIRPANSSLSITYEHL